MLDYDEEAERYDALRGGEPRAQAAAEAVMGLVPRQARRLLDVACGTGIVTRRFPASRPGLRVTGVDLSSSMTLRAAARLPGAVVRADSRRLPFRDASFDAVVSVWLLHLLTDPADVRAVVAECARVLRPGGVYVTTVHKGLSHNVGSDIDAVLAARPPSPVPDDPDTVAACAAGHGLVPAGRPASGATARAAARAGRWTTCGAAGSSPSRPAGPSPRSSPPASRPSPTRTAPALTRCSP